MILLIRSYGLLNSLTRLTRFLEDSKKKINFSLLYFVNIYNNKSYIC